MGEIEGAVQALDRAFRWLRGQLLAVGTAAAPGTEPVLEGETASAPIGGAARAGEFHGSVLVRIGDVDQAPDPVVLADVTRVLAESGWQVGAPRGADFGRTVVTAERDGFVVEATSYQGSGAVRLRGTTPAVRVYEVGEWERPEAARTPDTVSLGYVLCYECDGWGSCPVCEGQGRVGDRNCPECAGRKYCPICFGVGQLESGAPAGASGSGSGRPLRLARSNAEAHQYLRLHAARCPGCGVNDLEYKSSVVMVDGYLAARYVAECPGCGWEIVHEFRLPEVPLVTPPGEVVFGGPEPSELLDPGEWLALADDMARRVPQDASGLDDTGRRSARYTLATAVAAIDEVLKFLPPDREVMPGGLFTSSEGRAVWEREPGRFSRARLSAVRDSYASWLERF